MTSTMNLKVRHNGQIKTIALYSGLASAELSCILQAVFQLNAAAVVVGFLSPENGLVIPISLACKAPENLTASLEYNLLVSVAEQRVGSPPLPPQKVTTIQNKISTSAALSVAPPTAPIEEKQLIADDEQTEYAMSEILRFITGLRVRLILSSEESKSLEELLFENSTLLYAAYSVAVSASDAEYFAEICRDLAQSLQSEAGRTACEAQDEVLQICDQLYLAHKITENQLLYLRHLVLIREEAVASIYDDFQEHISIPKLAKALYELANTHPYQAEGLTPRIQNSNQLQGAEGDDEEEELEDDAQRTDSSNPLAIAILRKIIGAMLSMDMITKPEASVLTDMARAGNEYVTAALELYQSDENMEEFQDTLTRCARLEVRKKAAFMREARLVAKHEYERKQLQLAQDSMYKYDGNEDEEEDNEQTAGQSKGKGQGMSAATQVKKIAYANKTGRGVPENEEEEDEEAGEEEDDEEGGEYEVEEEGEGEGEDDDEAELQSAFNARERRGSENDEGGSLDFVHLDSLMNILGLTNRWTQTVPRRFVAAVFISAHRKLLTVGQASALCDLFEAQYDLVRAAWEVFSMQGDTRDFTDTLRRIVRDLPFKENGEVNYDGHGPVKIGAPTLPSRSAPASSSSAPSSSSAAGKSVSKAVDAAQLLNLTEKDGKRNALAAVVTAKRELLKHSLEMMVKQELASPEGAASLYERALEGDALVDAAIEAYAADRDVTEFLDTLQILSSHTPEALDAILRNAAKGDVDLDKIGVPARVAPGVSRPLLHVDPPTLPKKQTNGATDSGPLSPGISALDPAQKGLRGIIMQLAEEDVLPAEAADVLLGFVRDKDSRVIDLYTNFQTMHDANALINSLMKLAVLEIQSQLEEQRAYLTAATAKQAARSPMKLPPPRIPVQVPSPPQASAATGSALSSTGGGGGGGAPEEGLLNSADRKTVVEILGRAGAISPEQAAALNILIAKGDDRIKRVFTVYEADKDVYKLIDALKIFNIESQRNPFNTEDDDDEEQEGNTEKVTNNVESRFAYIVQSMKLNNMETAALRLAIARNDTSIRNALETFRDDSSESNLSATLRRISRQTIDDTLEEKEADQNREEEGDDDEGEEGDEDEEEEEFNEEEEEDDEDDEGRLYDDDEEDEEEEEEDYVHDEGNFYADHDDANAGQFDRTVSNGRHKDGTVNNNDDNFLHVAKSWQGRGVPERKGLHEEKEGSDGEEEEEEEDDNEEEEDEEEDEEEEDDEDEEAKAENRVQAGESSREHVFPILVSELVKESILDKLQGASLLRLFRKGNHQVTAALDAYDRVSDMGELVDALTQAVSAT